MPKDTITEQEAVQILKDLAGKEGSQSNAAAKLNISAAHYSDILRGNRGVSDEIAKKLGYRRVIVFERVKG